MYVRLVMIINLLVADVIWRIELVLFVQRQILDYLL